MKQINTLVTVVFISLLSSPSWSVSSDDLVEREGIYYEKFTDVPFTGKVTGNPQGSFKNGKFDGTWVTYREDGQLRFKGNYKSNKKEGARVSYNKDGTVDALFTGTYKEGVKISD